MAAQLALHLAVLCPSLVNPSAYARHRTLLLFSHRMLVYLPPSSRGMDGLPGALQRTATPGRWGLLSDWAKLLMGEMPRW